MNDQHKARWKVLVKDCQENKYSSINVAGKTVREAIIAADEERTELLDTLEDVLRQSCLDNADTLDSMALSAYADGLHLLERHGMVVILRESGRRVIAKRRDNERL